MLIEEKNNLLAAVNKHLLKVTAAIHKKISVVSSFLEREKTERKSVCDPDRLLQDNLLSRSEKRLEELKVLQSSPYFTRCEVATEDGGHKVYYFSKFLFDEEKIYSWVSAAAAMRFENPGPVAYIRPDGHPQRGILLKKDQYLIVGGRVLFFARESEEGGRELVYQENFSNRKSGFVLPEIVAQMEKAQDQVIRAHNAGPLLISGPAGSGKTTLAFHRLAYLMRSPETAENYTASQVAVLVQDTGTKEYFSRLLPELGIESVKVSTFFEWASGLLGLKDYAYVDRFGNDEKEKDAYEFFKWQALKNGRVLSYTGSVWDDLNRLYEPLATVEELACWRRQRETGQLDRFDTTYLLSAYLKTHGHFNVLVEKYIDAKNGLLKRIREEERLAYSLIIADEFQNYLPEQLSVLRSALSGNGAMLYVGDTAQQTQLGCLKSIIEVGESIPPERKVVLQKVYRNTRNILSYIADLGYNVAVPEQIRIGQEVVEKIMSQTEELAYVEKIVANLAGRSLGVLAKDEKYLSVFKEKFSGFGNVHVFTMREAQGVEFEVVCLVGISSANFKLDYQPQLLLQEKARIQKDLLYVALTRAMDELHVLGRDSLREVVKSFTDN